GHDATPEDVAPLAADLDPDGRFVVATVEGPLRADTGRAGVAPGPLGPAKESVIGAIEALHDTIDELCAPRDLDRHRVVVAGFSQGGATALALALSDVGRVRPVAVACLSGFLPDVIGHEYDWTGASGTAVLVQ